MKYYIIPEPQSISLTDDIAFDIGGSWSLTCEEGCGKAERQLLFLTEKSFQIKPDTTSPNSIVIALDEGMNKSEGYTLIMKKNSVKIVGSDEAGAFYGVQTLYQLMLQGGGKIPCGTVEDYPRYGYRGFMLDCSRYFFTKEAVLKFIDAMAAHKLNHFHWHLSDDQGYRAQVENQLLLTEIGSYRSHTNFGKTPHYGYYTKADMKEIVDYCHERCIKVIPEIDTPGHAVAMIAAYPFLSCFDREMVVATHTGIKHDVLCVGKESTYEFIFSVLDELTEIFTDGVFHLGGDEVPTMRWEICTHCQRKLKEIGGKEASDLHTYYLDRVADHLREKGIKVIMWNDRIKDNMTSRKTAWQLWNGEMSKEDVVRELEAGRDFILANASAFYLDLPYIQTNLKKCYEFDTDYLGIKGNEPGSVWGLEACLWTEYVPTMKKAGYCAFPRLGAFSECAWTEKEKKSYPRFEEKLDTYYAMLDVLGMDYAVKKQAMPSLIRGGGYFLWWERRKLHWQGLHNLIDDAMVKRKADTMYNS